MNTRQEGKVLHKQRLGDELNPNPCKGSPCVFKTYPETEEKNLQNKHIATNYCIELW